MLDRIKNIWTGKGASARPPLEKYYALALCALFSYMVADLVVLDYRPLMLPKEAPPVRPAKLNRTRMQNLADYNVISERDIFNEDGKIPDALSAGKGEDRMDRPAVLSQLPIQLLGTIVHFNPKMSIATVSISSKNISSSYKVDDEIEGLAKITKIERKKVTFINLNNRRNEYIEIPDDSAFNFGMQTAAAPSEGNDLVQKRGKFDFAMKRSDLDGLTQNLSSLLQQARMEPVFSSDGISVEGFKFATIAPGSVFEKLGFTPNDMITCVNGEPVNSPTKAMEMYNVLKTSNNVQLCVTRDGHEEKFNYNVQ